MRNRRKAPPPAIPQPGDIYTAGFGDRRVVVSVTMNGTLPTHVEAQTAGKTMAPHSWTWHDWCKFARRARVTRGAAVQ